MMFQVTPDTEHANKIRTALKENGGYCPCRLTKSAETKCICQDFLNNVPAGEFCHCGLYKKIED